MAKSQKKLEKALRKAVKQQSGGRDLGKPLAPGVTGNATAAALGYVSKAQKANAGRSAKQLLGLAKMAVLEGRRQRDPSFGRTSLGPNVTDLAIKTHTLGDDPSIGGV